MDTPNSSVKADGWTQDRVELIKRFVCPKGISTEELALFVEQCRRSGLDPLLKQAFCVSRRQNVGTRERPQWIEKHEFQPAEAGMLARAEHFPDYLGIQAEAVYAEDEISMDSGSGTIVHRFNPAKRKGSLVGAWAKVVRREKVPTLVWMDLAAVVQQTPMWSRMPAVMVAKCARVAALRKAFPEAFGGMYIREELPPDVAGEVVDVSAHVEPERPALPPVTDLHAVIPPPTVETGRVEVPRQELHRRAALAQSSPTRVGPWVVEFGPHKGRPIADLSDMELQATVDQYNERLMAHPRAKWAKAVRDNLALLEAEVDVRFHKREPGSEG